MLMLALGVRGGHDAYARPDGGKLVLCERDGRDAGLPGWAHGRVLSGKAF